MAFPPSDELQHQQEHHQQQQESQQQQHHTPPQAPQPEFSGETLTPEEAARRDRVRASARERQRKHRQLVKQRKMRELGMDMGNELIPGMEEVHYRVNAEGQYQQVLPHELQHHPHPINHHEPPFPHGQPLGGQTFASTLLLSFSCAPLLKQNLLRSLVMTNEELASLEPIIAEAWDRWDHQVCIQSSFYLNCTLNVDLIDHSAVSTTQSMPPKLAGPACPARHPLRLLIWANTLAIRSSQVTRPSRRRTTSAPDSTVHSSHPLLSAPLRQIRRRQPPCLRPRQLGLDLAIPSTPI
jgi:hypothetical protein